MKANAVQIGTIETAHRDDSFTTEYGMLLSFPNAESLRVAIQEGRCEFTLFAENGTGEL